MHVEKIVLLRLIGKKLLKKITTTFVQITVAVMIMLMAIAIGLGVL